MASTERLKAGDEPYLLRLLRSWLHATALHVSVDHARATGHSTLERHFRTVLDLIEG